MRKDWDNIALCDRFFDALERKDFATVESCYGPEAVVWHSHDCLYQSRDSNLAMLKASIESPRQMKYENRRVRAFEGGFVQQHQMLLTHESGFVGKMDVCFVAYVRNGKISRIYEYFDTGRREEFLGSQT
ncbi:MAG: nuclear transport factor 2 family protein [Phenylobacterium sp.]|nr:nuclear transport factor 2 family protein [Phenylobacterium sp.]